MGMEEIQENKEVEVNELISNLQDKVLSLIEKYEETVKSKESVLDEIEELRKENVELKEKIDSLEKEIEERNKKEKDMKDKIVDLMETIESSIPMEEKDVGKENNDY